MIVLIKYLLSSSQKKNRLSEQGLFKHSIVVANRFIVLNFKLFIYNMIATVL